MCGYGCAEMVIVLNNREKIVKMQSDEAWKEAKGGKKVGKKSQGGRKCGVMPEEKLNFFKIQALLYQRLNSRVWISQ